jgi:hypothetical protein
VESLEAYTQALIATIKQRIGFEDCTPELNEAWKMFLIYISNSMMWETVTRVPSLYATQ